MRSRLLTSVFATAGILSAAGPARGGQPVDAAADDGPVIIGSKRGVYRTLELHRVDAAFEFLGQYRKDTQKSADGSKLTDTETQLRETLNVSTEAYIGHKNLIDFSGDVKLGLEDITLDSQTAGQKTTDSSLLTLFDVRALILGESDLPVTAYARRDDTLVNRDFAGSIDSVTLEYGLVGTLRSKVAPTSLQVFHREQDQTDQLSTVDYHQVQDTIALDSNVKISEAQRLELDYTFDRATEEQGSLYKDEYDRHDGTFTHLIDFGPENRHNLRSSLRVYDQTGIADQSLIRLDEQLRLHHSDRLESWYDGTIERQSHAGVDQNFARGAAHLRHKLFDSLVSTGGMGASQLEIPGDFTSREIFGSAGLDYTKKVPLGRLNASAAVDLNSQDNSERGSVLPVANESRTFNDPFPITLSRRNINPASIRVTHLSGFPTYNAGSDYTIDAFPDRVELRRIVGGGIADGETVLISYDVGAEPANTIDTTTYVITLRYTIEEGWLTGLSPYMIYTQTDHRLGTADASLIALDDIRSLTYGMDYRIGDFAFKAEQENHDSTFQPFDARRLEATYNRRLGLGSSLNLSATQDRIDYRLDDNTLELARLRGRLNYNLGQTLDMMVELIYRDETQTRGSSVKGFEQGVQFNWHLRQTSVFVSLRNAMLDGDSVDTTSQTFALGFRRDF